MKISRNSKSYTRYLQLRYYNLSNECVFFVSHTIEVLLGLFCWVIYVYMNLLIADFSIGLPFVQVPKPYNWHDEWSDVSVLFPWGSHFPGGV